MKGKSQIIRLSFLAVAATLFISCKKHPGSSTQCMITEVRKNDTSIVEMQLSYDSSKRLSTIYYTESGAKEVFTYASNLEVRTKINNTGLVFERDSIFLNPDGQASSITYFNSTSGKVDEYDSMYYDAYNQLEKITHRSTKPGYTWTESYAWDNGDAVTYNFNGSIGTYIYNADKPAMDGDLNEISDIFKYGIVTKRCKHLYEGDKAGTLDYRFDKDGKITSVFFSGPSSEQVYSYTYTCF